MPFVKRKITPRCLTRQNAAVPAAGKATANSEFGSVVNVALVGTLHQLSSLLKHADDIFADLSFECQKITQRTSRIKDRVVNLSAVTENLNARDVKVPVGDLISYATNPPEPYIAEHGFESSLFTPASRPHCVSDLYDSVEPSPLTTIRRCNMLRSDGRTGSKIFSLPLVLATDKTEQGDQELALRKPTLPPLIEREPRKVLSPRKRPYSVSTETDLDIHSNSDPTLPTPEERLRTLSRSQPVTLIPIDVSGSSFSRMCQYRSSLRSLHQDAAMEVDVETLRRRSLKKRRRTVSEVPSFIISSAGDLTSVPPVRTRSVSRDRWERPHSMGLDQYAPRGELIERRSRSRERRSMRKNRDRFQDRDNSPLFRSCSLRRSLTSLFRGSRSKSTDLWMDGRPATPDPPQFDLEGTLRRCRSLPRSLRSRNQDVTVSRIETRSASTEGRLDAWEEADEDNLLLLKPPKGPSSISTGSLPRSLPRSRSQNIHHRTTTTFLDNTLPRRRTRPISMDFGSRLGIPIPTTPSTGSTASITTSNDHLPGRLNIVPGQPAWTAFAADVKLRQHADKPCVDDRQSSSGHWSASSSSARQSLDSEYQRVLDRMKSSQHSIDRDSAVSLNIHSSGPSEERYDTTDNNMDITTGDETSTVTADTSTIVGDDSTLHGSQTSLNLLKVDVNKAPDWLSKKEKRRSRAASLPLRRMASDSSTESWASNSRLTQQNLRAHDFVHKPFGRSRSSPDNDESSTYSVDQEGFYTSMHMDSGLKNITEGTLNDTVDHNLGTFTSSNSTLNSLAGAEANGAKKKSGLFNGFSSKLRSGKRSKKKAPPPPPRRMSTIIDKSNLTLNEEFDDAFETTPLFPSPSPSPEDSSHNATTSSKETVIENKYRSALSNDSANESDAEVVYARLKQKTSISAATIPSLCVMLSDEEDGDLLGSDSWRDGSSPEFDGYKILSKTSPSKTSNVPLLKPLASRAKDGSETIAIDVNNSSWPRQSFRRGSEFSTFRGDDDVKSTSGSSIRESNSDILRTHKSAVYTSSVTTGSSMSLFTQSDTTRGRSPSFSSSVVGSSSSGDPNKAALPDKYTHSVKVMPHGDGPQCTSTPRSSAHEDGKGHVFANVIIKDGPLEKKVAPSVPVRSSSTSLDKSHASSGSLSKSKDSLLSPSLASDTSTWPRANKSPDTLKRSSILSPPSGQMKCVGLDGDMNTFPRKDDRKHFTTPDVPVGGRVFTPPVAASAKLIISAPVATKVSFRENPYKRSVCSPVSTEEFNAIWNSTINSPAAEGASLKETNSGSASSTSTNTPLHKPSILKQTPTADLSNYGGAWYGGIQTATSKSVAKTPTVKTPNILSLDSKHQLTFASPSTSEPRKPLEISTPVVPSVYDSLGRNSTASQRSSVSRESGSSSNNASSQAGDIVLVKTDTLKSSPKKSVKEEGKENNDGQGSIVTLSTFGRDNSHDRSRDRESPARPTHLALVKPEARQPNKPEQTQSGQTESSKSDKDSNEMSTDKSDGASKDILGANGSSGSKSDADGARKPSNVQSPKSSHRPSPVRVTFPQGATPTSSTASSTNNVIKASVTRGATGKATGGARVSVSNLHEKASSPARETPTSSLERNSTSSRLSSFRPTFKLTGALTSKGSSTVKDASQDTAKSSGSLRRRDDSPKKKDDKVVVNVQKTGGSSAGAGAGGADKSKTAEGETAKKTSDSSPTKVCASPLRHASPSRELPRLSTFSPHKSSVAPLTKSVPSTSASTPPSTPKSVGQHRFSDVKPASCDRPFRRQRSVSPSSSEGRMKPLSLARSTDSLANCSIGSASNLHTSTLSLNRSSESLTSTGSHHSERMRAAKLAFLALSESPEKENSPPPDPFARYKIGNKSPSPGRSRPPSGSAPSSPIERPSAVQGRFVNSVINQLARKTSTDSLTVASPTSPSSGLGSSLATTPMSPASPARSVSSSVHQSPDMQQTTTAHGYKDPRAHSSAEQIAQLRALQYQQRPVNPSTTESSV